jgi:hypothetical protein
MGQRDMEQRKSRRWSFFKWGRPSNRVSLVRIFHFPQLYQGSTFLRYRRQTSSVILRPPTLPWNLQIFILPWTQVTMAMQDAAPGEPSRNGQWPGMLAVLHEYSKNGLLPTLYGHIQPSKRKKRWVKERVWQFVKCRTGLSTLGGGMAINYHRVPQQLPTPRQSRYSPVIP